MLDYYEEIEYFDRQLGRMIAAIEKAGELANTLILVCADNGMSFPRAKANVYEYGIHLPAAIAWPAPPTRWWTTTAPAWPWPKS